jgi:hypothetical protein
MTIDYTARTVPGAFGFKRLLNPYADSDSHVQE